jgi:ribosome maturation factor RimP
LTELIEPEVEAEGLALVRVMMIGGKDDPTLQVMAERPDTRQLTLQDCERLSRRLSSGSTSPIRSWKATDSRSARPASTAL